jgi:hypothetical protein
MAALAYAFKALPAVVPRWASRIAAGVAMIAKSS